MKYILLFLLFFALYLCGLAGMHSFMDVDYSTQLWMHLIPIIVSLLIVTLILFSVTKNNGKNVGNRPRSALIAGIIWAILFGVCDYVLITDGIDLLSKILPDTDPDSFIGALFGIFGSIKQGYFYGSNLIAVIIRYLIIVVFPFVLSLFVPKGSD